MLTTRCAVTVARRWRAAPCQALARFSSASSNDDHSHRLFEEQMLELKEEREALFGFTEGDQRAWANAADHKHEESFLSQINHARILADEAKKPTPAQRIETERITEDYASWSYSQGPPAKARADHPFSHFSGPSLTQPPVTNLSPDGESSPTGSSHSTRQPFTHVSPDGQSVSMVDIGAKVATKRVAVAQSRVVFPPEVVEALKQSNGDLLGPKGPVFATAKLAGVMAAKKTSDLIPLCHPLPLDKVHIDIELLNNSVAVIRCECRVTHATGVEMEALMGASVAALTIYDMTKAVSHRIRIEDTVLLSKSGGKRTVG